MRLLAVFALPLVALLLGCAPDPSPAASPAAAGAPDVGPRLRSLGEGAIQLSLTPSGSMDLDPLNMAINLGVTPPPCADFIMLFAWQITGPNPVGDARVGFSGERMGGRFEVAAPAAAGQASIGCALLRAVNAGPTPVSFQLRFVVATPKR